MYYNFSSYHESSNHRYQDKSEGTGESKKGNLNGINNGNDMCHHDTLNQSSYHQDKHKILHRLNRIEGQIKGIRKMVDEDRYCVDILNQIAAARAALDSIAIIFFEDHTRGCVSRAIKNQEGEKEIIQELMEVMDKFIR